jgi:hypothetical protein
MDSTTWHLVILISLSRFICTISPCSILSTTWSIATSGHGSESNREYMSTGLLELLQL